MLPYDFTKENYFKTGFVAEGFTTYYGDLLLVRSGVIDEEAYLNKLTLCMERHFENEGNHTLSLADASYDLWVDGYKETTPHRRVSIYVKGCVTAFLLDMEMRMQSNNEKSLDDLMRILWNEFALHSKGYTEKDIVELSGVGDTFFDEVIYGTTDLKPQIIRALKYVGCQLLSVDSTLKNESDFGLRVLIKEGKVFVESVAPGSPADAVLTKDDEIVAINKRKLTATNVDKLFDDTYVEIFFFRAGVLKKAQLQKKEEKYFTQYLIMKSLRWVKKYF
jgi:predicted metalloprotease with PDZ domain